MLCYFYPKCVHSVWIYTYWQISCLSSYGYVPQELIIEFHDSRYLLLYETLISYMKFYDKFLGTVGIAEDLNEHICKHRGWSMSKAFRWQICKIHHRVFRFRRKLSHLPSLVACLVVTFFCYSQFFVHRLFSGVTLCVKNWLFFSVIPGVRCTINFWCYSL